MMCNDSNRNTRIGFRPARPVVVMAVLVLWLVIAAVPTVAGEELSHEDRIIAGFVFNFCKVVTWPDKTDEIHLVVVGTDGPSQALLDIDGKTSGGKTLRVSRKADGLDLSVCDLIYISPTAATNSDSLLQELGNSPILTVSTAENFCQKGGMIEMTRDRGRIRLKVNPKRAAAADLTLSSQLLKIVTVVDE